MVNDRCLCPVAASTHQVGAPSLSASLSAMIRWFVDGSLLIGKSHMQSGWEAAVSLVNASPADSTAWQATGRIWTQAPGYKHTQSEWLRFPVEEFHANGGKKIIQINTKPNQNYSEPI